MDDGLRPVVHRREFYGTRQTRAQFGEESPDGVRYFHCVCARLPVNRKHDYRTRRIKTAHPEKARDALVLNALAHISDIAQVNGPAVRVTRNDQVAISLGVVDLSVRLQ